MFPIMVVHVNAHSGTLNHFRVSLHTWNLLSHVTTLLATDTDCIPITELFTAEKALKMTSENFNITLIKVQCYLC